MKLGYKHFYEAIESGTWKAYRDGQQIGVDRLTINPNSVNVSLGHKMLVSIINRPRYNYIDLHEPESVNYKLVEGREFHLTQMDFVLMHVRERFDCRAPLMIDGKPTHFAPMIEGRSTPGRCGLSIHRTAGFADVGFISNFTLEVSAKMNIILRTGDEIGQVYFESSSDGSVKYQGAYTSQHDAPKAPVLGKDRFARWG